MCDRTVDAGGDASNMTRFTRNCIESIPPTPSTSIQGCLRCAPRGAIYNTIRPSHGVLILTRHTCQPMQTPPTSTTLSCSTAAAPPQQLGDGRGWSAERTHQRDRIEHSAAVTHRSSGQTTARLRDRIQDASAIRGLEFQRRRPPPPPCPTPQAPQPGVPQAPQLPCNPGNQRVDFISPWR
jgi:hypothetical protein